MFGKYTSDNPENPSISLHHASFSSKQATLLRMLGSSCALVYTGGGGVNTVGGVGHVRGYDGCNTHESSVLEGTHVIASVVADAGNCSEHVIAPGSIVTPRHCCVTQLDLQSFTNWFASRYLASIFSISDLPWKVQLCLSYNAPVSYTHLTLPTKRIV